MNNQFFNALNSIDLENNFFDPDSMTSCLYRDVNDFKNDFINESSMSVLCFNIRSFYKNIDEFLAILSLNESNIDIIVLTETWLNNDNKQLGCIPGYVSYHCYRDSKIGGGVSIFVKESFISEPLDLNINNNSIECIGIKFKSKTNNDWANIIGVYRPPSGPIDEFNSKLEEIISPTYINSSNCIIAGDFNICLMNEETRRGSTELISLMNRFYFHTAVTKATRITDNTAALIDHIWSNIPFGVTSGIIVSGITDHFPIYACFKNFKDKENDLVKIKFRSFSTENVNMFKECLCNVDWDTVLGNSNNADVITEKFLHQFQIMFDKFFPIKIKNISKKRLNKPWLSTSLVKSIRLKHLLYKQTKQGILSRESYNAYSNLLSKCIKQSKKFHFKRTFETINDNIKKTWKVINNI